MSSHPLEPLMVPRSVAVLGASSRDGALGNTVVKNLLRSGYSGPIFPVHPSAVEVHGIRSYPDVASIPIEVECCVVCLSADKVISALEGASKSGVPAAVVFASGFAETDEEGASRQRALQDLSMRTGMKICGPNCLGLANISKGISLYSASIPDTLAVGDVAVLSHSGSGCIVLSSLGRFGVSHLVSIGNAAVIDIDQYLDYLATDDAARVAALFIETIRDPAAFAAGAAKMKEAGKTIVALKVGRSEKGAAATAAHTGSLSGANAVYEEFFKNCGVVLVEDLDELVESIVLMRSARAKPTGRGVAVINVSGGEIALTCDLAQRIGLELPELSQLTQEKIASILPSFGRATNPLDATGAAVFDMGVYGACIAALADDPSVSLVAVSQDCPSALGSEQAETYRPMAEKVAELSRTIEKPLVFYSNVAGGIHPRVAEPLLSAGVPLLQGARASLLAVKRFLDNHVTEVSVAATSGNMVVNRDWFNRLASGQPLTERETKLFLAECGLAVTREALATSMAEATAIAGMLSFPVAMKIESPDLPHKSDFGGVKLNLRSAEEVELAYCEILASVARLAPTARVSGILVQEMVASGVEVIVGLTREDPFGMTVVVGAGGVLVELVRDSALALVPITTERAAKLIARTRVSKLLAGYRGAPPSDVGALAVFLSRLSWVGAAYSEVISALDLNPVWVGAKGDGVRIVDALLIPKMTHSE